MHQQRLAYRKLIEISRIAAECRSICLARAAFGRSKRTDHRLAANIIIIIIEQSDNVQFLSNNPPEDKNNFAFLLHTQLLRRDEPNASDVYFPKCSTLKEKAEKRDYFTSNRDLCVAGEINDFSMFSKIIEKDKKKIKK